VAEPVEATGVYLVGAFDRLRDHVHTYREPMVGRSVVKGSMNEKTKNDAIAALNRIMELELAGVVPYTHYSLMVYGFNRIPIVSWLKGNALEGLQHAQRAGELVTLLGGHPSLAIGALLEVERHDIGDILRESLAHGKVALGAYYDLLIGWRIHSANKVERPRGEIKQRKTAFGAFPDRQSAPP
jgi:bacterioferritin